MSLRIFLSHAWKDKNLAAFKKIESTLRKSYDVFVDKGGIEFGELIDHRLDEALVGSDLVLVLWSQNAHQSVHVMREVETALHHRKPVVACKISDYEPDEYPALRGRKFLRFDRLPDVGLMHLEQFLIRMQNQQNQAFGTDAGLQAQIAALNDMISEIEDWEYRKEMGHTGNEASSAYVDQMVEMGKVLLATSGSMPAEEKRRMSLFFERLQEIARNHPDPSEDALKKQLLVEAIDEVDPAGESQKLQMFKLVVMAAGGLS